MKINQKSTKSLIFTCFMAFFVLLAGCMDTNLPSDTSAYNLKVKAYLVDATNASKTPLRGVAVAATDNNNQTSNGTTNEKGQATLAINVPNTGGQFNVSADYNNNIQRRTAVTVCQDTALVFLFDDVVVPTIDCGDLNGNDSLIFMNLQGSPRLVQNTPKGVNYYEKCWSMSNSASNNSNIVATIPTIASPFKISSIQVGTTIINNPTSQQTVTIAPGQTLTICFQVSTTQTGTYTPNFTIGLACSSNQGRFTLNMSANVVAPVCNCEDIPSTYTLVMPNSTTVGSSTQTTEAIFTNTLSCPVTITSMTLRDNTNWTILAPTLPVTVGVGQSLSLTVRFNPTSAGANNTTLMLNLLPQGATDPCRMDITLQGNACTGACPQFSKNRNDYTTFNPQKTQVDTLSERDDNRVFVSIKDVNPVTLSTVRQTYYILNPDSACNSVTINVGVKYADSYAQTYYSVSPSTLTLAPGETGAVEMSFTAPSRSELDAIVTARGHTGNLTDSLFALTLTLTSSGCTQYINVNSVVTVYPEISPIINLRAYNQSTTQKPDPEHEVYYFGNNSRTIINQGTYPPTNGDIYIDVNDNNSSAKPPQEPILKLIDNAIGMKVWRTNYSESAFANVPALIDAFQNDVNHASGYGTSPLTNLQVGDVIAFKFSDNTYAMIYIRRVDNGTEATSSKQSGIEFRAIYGIFVN